MIEHFHEDILGIAPVNAAAVPVDQKSIDKMRLRIDLAVASEQTALGYETVFMLDLNFQPEFVGIDGPLGQVMPQLQGAHHNFQQIITAGLQHGQNGAQGGMQRAVNRVPFAHAEQVDADFPLQKVLVFAHDLVPMRQPRNRRVRRGKQVIVNGEGTAWHQFAGRDIPGGLSGHMAAIAVLLGDFRIVETPRTMPGNATEQKTVVMILAAQEVLVVVQCLGEMHLVTDRAELRGLVQWLQVGLFVQRGFCLD